MFKFPKSKIVWMPLAVIIVIVGLVLRSSTGKKTYTPAGTVAKQDVQQSVLATGTVTSQSDLNLSFKGSGVITAVNASVGNKVHKGQVLATLDERDASAAINQASASLLAAKANYDKLVNGASSPQIQVSQAAVDAAQVTLDNANNTLKNTTSQQATIVANAYATMINSGLAAAPAAGNFSTSTVTISGTYSGTQQGEITLNLYYSEGGLSFSATGIGTASGYISRGTPVAIGKTGLYLTFGTTGNLNVGASWTIAIPNTQSSTYLANSNDYQAALQTQTQAVSSAQGAVDSAQAALEQAQANLQLQQSAPRSEDLAAAQAQIQTAQAQLQQAQNQYANNEIIAPIDGTVTVINIKLGETAVPNSTALTMLDSADLHIESNISESSITQVQVGQSIDMTLDAFGPDRHFSGEVISIDPASTVVSGVIDYRVISSIPTDQGIKPGMTVNLVIMIADKQNVLAVPNRLISTDGNGKQSVMVLENGKPVSVGITTGLVGDQFTEVTSGLNGGETLVTTTVSGS